MNALIRFATTAARDAALDRIRENAPDVASCIVRPESLPDLVVQKAPSERVVTLHQLVGDEARWFEDIQFETL